MPSAPCAFRSLCLHHPELTRVWEHVLMSFVLPDDDSIQRLNQSLLVCELELRMLWYKRKSESLVENMVYMDLKQPMRSFYHQQTDTYRHQYSLKQHMSIECSYRFDQHGCCYWQAISGIDK